MPPAALTSSRQNSAPRSCATESTLSGPDCETVMPMVMVSSPAAIPGMAKDRPVAVASQNLFIHPPRFDLRSAEPGGYILPSKGDPRHKASLSQLPPQGSNNM